MYFIYFKYINYLNVQQQYKYENDLVNKYNYISFCEKYVQILSDI